MRLCLRSKIGDHHNQAVMTFSCRSLFLLLVLCATVLRMGGAHVHVALDHDEALPVLHDGWHANAPDQHAIHAEQDADAHDHAAHDHNSYQHAQVSLDQQALSKKLGADLALDALLFVLILLCIPLAVGTLRLPSINSFLPATRLVHLRPPLRGPPRLSPSLKH